MLYVWCNFFESYTFLRKQRVLLNNERLLSDKAGLLENKAGLLDKISPNEKIFSANKKYFSPNKKFITPRVMTENHANYPFPVFSGRLHLVSLMTVMTDDSFLKMEV